MQHNAMMMFVVGRRKQYECRRARGNENNLVRGVHVWANDRQFLNKWAMSQSTNVVDPVLLTTMFFRSVMSPCRETPHR
jgi:hypothetical protein